MKALFLAGGSGTRLWPISRKKNPKQLHSLLGEQSLMFDTIARTSPIVAPQDTWIVTNVEYAGQIASEAAGVPHHQIVGEPYPLGTSFAVGLGLIHIAHEFPDETVIIG